MDCRGDELIQHNNRASAQAVPFQYLINEQAKSILALQELQNEVGALLEFRDMVMDTFPHLRQKQVSSPEPSSGSQGAGCGESRWEPGVRVRRKLQGSSPGWIAGGGLATGGGAGPRSRSNSHGKGPKSGEPATASVGTVQDSGFCTESKDSSSTSSRTTTTTMTKNDDGGGGGGKDDDDDDEDELWSLLEVIQDKGTKLKLEAEFLQNRLLDDEQLRRRCRWSRRLRRCRSLDDLQRPPARAAVADDYCDYNVFRAHVSDLKRERDELLDRVTEMEAESLSNAAQIHRLLVELKAVVCENRELEERLCGGVVVKSSSSPKKPSSHNGGGGFAPVQPESSTGPSSSSAGRDAFYTPSQHSTCNLSSIELQCKQCPSAASSSATSSLSAAASSSYTDTATASDDLLHRHHHHQHHQQQHHHRSRRVLLARPSDPISRNLEGRAASPPPPAVDIGSPTFAKRLGALDGIVSSPIDRIGKPVPGCGTTAGTPLPRRTLAAILKTFNPIELQRHLITVSYENKTLVRQVEILSKSKCDVTNELNASRDDNEELKFQLEEKRIELEGTMARVRLLQLHQEQQQHGPSYTGAGGQLLQSSGATAAAATTNQWLDLVPSNPILPQIALPGTPSAASHHHQSNNHHHQQQQQHHHHLHNPGHLHQHQDENGGGGSSSTESAHQARNGGGNNKHNQPSKIPVVKSSAAYATATRPPSSYREHHSGNRDPYPSWNKCKSDQSYSRNWDPVANGKSNGSASSIGSGGGGKSNRGGSCRQDSLLQDTAGGKQPPHHHRSRRDSGGGGASLTRAKSQNHHHQRSAAGSDSGRTAASCKDHRAAGGGGGGTAVASAAADDTNKVRPTKRFANILNSWIRKS